MGQQIPIYIPSFNRSKTIKTPAFLDKSGVSYKVLLHSEECKAEYLAEGRVREEDIIVTGADFGITNQRRWITDNLAVHGEWYVSMDDNVRGFTTTSDEIYGGEEKIDTSAPQYTRSDFNHELTAAGYLEKLEVDIQLSETLGSEYIGYSTIDNYYFRRKKYRHIGYIISKVCAIKYSGIEYDPNLEAMEDFGYCAEQLVTNGRVLINSWIFPLSGHYQKGGIGTYEARVPRKILDCSYLMEKFPELFRYKTKKDCHPQAELQFRFTSLKQMEKWMTKYRPKTLITNELN